MMKDLATNHEIDITLRTVTLNGRYRIAEEAKGFVIFSHGSGSSRLSTRNNYVADLLKEAGFSSLLFDLLTEKEDLIYTNRFDIELLTNRLVEVTRWILEKDKIKEIPIGFFGASTGAASALNAATHLGKNIKAIVSRGGRPDLAINILDKVTCPTLLIVGGEDFEVIELNKEAYEKLESVKQLKIIEGATHLFSESGKLDEVAKLTAEWYNKYLK